MFYGAELNLNFFMRFLFFKIIQHETRMRSECVSPSVVSVDFSLLHYYKGYYLIYI